MGKKLVSIIIPMYNGAKFLRRCLDSIKCQTYKNLEIILVDDGSVDNSGDICDDYCSNDKRFIVIHKENEGVSKARVDGYNASAGEYIFFVDADDYIEKNTIDILVNDLERNNVDIAVCSANEIVGNVSTKIIRSVKGYYDKSGIMNLLSTNLLFDTKNSRSGVALEIWGKLCRRNALKGVLHAGEGLWYGEDMMVVLSIMHNIDSFYVDEECLYNYVRHAEQVTKRDPKQLFGAYTKLWERINDFDVNNLFSKQLPSRMFDAIKILLWKQMNQFPYKEYESFFYTIRESRIVREKLLENKKWKPHGIKMLSLFFVFKRSLPMVYYIIARNRHVLVKNRYIL